MAVFVVVAGIAIHSTWKAWREYTVQQDAPLTAEAVTAQNGAPEENAFATRPQPETPREEKTNQPPSASTADAARISPQHQTIYAESSAVTIYSGIPNRQGLPSGTQDGNTPPPNGTQNVSTPSPDNASSVPPALTPSSSEQTSAHAGEVPAVLKALPTLSSGSEIRSTLNPVPIPPVNADNSPLTPLPDESTPATPPDAAPPETKKPIPPHSEKTAVPQNVEKPSASTPPNVDTATPGQKNVTQISRTWTRLECEKDHVLFLISGKPALKSTSFALHHPDRIVLDLEGRWRVRPPQPRDTSFLVGIRCAIQPAGKTRIVFDLARAPQSWKATKIGTDTIELQIR